MQSPTNHWNYLEDLNVFACAILYDSHDPHTDWLLSRMMMIDYHMHIHSWILIVVSYYSWHTMSHCGSVAGRCLNCWVPSLWKDIRVSSTSSFEFDEFFSLCVHCGFICGTLMMMIGVLVVTTALAMLYKSICSCTECGIFSWICIRIVHHRFSCVDYIMIIIIIIIIIVFVHSYDSHDSLRHSEMFSVLTDSYHSPSAQILELCWREFQLALCHCRSYEDVRHCHDEFVKSALHQYVSVS